LTVLAMTSCWTSIWTVAPTDKVVVPVRTEYTTRVTTSTPKVTTTTTVYVTSYNEDLCFYLDLNAVAAAFAEARSVREFEQIINSSKYMINNLDLNRDGWIDYLRVIEMRSGAYHTLLIQACLAPSVFQDVATLVAERLADRLYVEVIGDPYLYGYNYIVRPVFIRRPPMWEVYGHASYSPWSSPYYYNYWPSYYTQPKPIYLNHYQAYVHTYMTNHHYCHTCSYPTAPYYSGYSHMTSSNSRHDYQTSHPEQSFEQRITRNASTNTNGVSVRNAGQLRNKVEAENKKNETTSTASSTRSQATTTTTTKTESSTRSGSTTRQPSTTVQTRVNKSGTTRTTITTTDDKGRTSTVKRESSNSSTRSSGTSTRSTGSSTRSSQGKSTGSSPRSGQRGR
ncbi:MAG: hypothetical protein II448_02765, partial [Paludibacteraceae bacterium]|nr:hypothetical protein [Paludibacteraceae bacterium]